MSERSKARAPWTKSGTYSNLAYDESDALMVDGELDDALGTLGVEVGSTLHFLAAKLRMGVTPTDAGGNELPDRARRCHHARPYAM